MFNESPLGRATPPPFYICFGTQGADWRNAACDAKLATAGGRHLAEMHTTYPVLNRSRENTPWSRGPPRRQRTLQRKKSRCRGGIVRVDFCRVWIGMCEGANTCLMPGGDGLPEGAMFRNEDGKRFLQIVTKSIAKL